MNEMNGVVGKLLLSVNAVESVILNLLSITRITNCFWCCVFSKIAKIISRERLLKLQNLL